VPMWRTLPQSTRGHPAPKFFVLLPVYDQPVQQRAFNSWYIVYCGNLLVVDCSCLANIHTVTCKLKKRDVHNLVSGELPSYLLTTYICSYLSPTIGLRPIESWNIIWERHYQCLLKDRIWVQHYETSDWSSCRQFVENSYTGCVKKHVQNDS
jgi:hypothetical protein